MTLALPLHTLARWLPVTKPQPWRAAALVALVAGFCVPLQAQTTPLATSESRSVNEWLMRMHEASRQRELIDRPEFKEGVRAFLEKREPKFPPR